jgi:hypothetical protein
MADYKETAFNYVEGDDFAVFCSGVRRWRTRINKLQKKYPDLVNIRREDEFAITAEIPSEWFKIAPKRVVSKKQREEAGKRLRKYHKKTKV